MTNRILFIIFYLLFIILYTSPLWAQSQSPGGGGRYVIEQRYVQQLVWIGDNYTLKYEVIIEKNEGGRYKEYIREFTEKPNLQVVLPLGKYRYRIIPYDYLEHPGQASGWVNIEIKPAPIVTVEVQKEDDGSYVLHPYESEEIVPGVIEIVINKHDDPVITEETETETETETENPVNLYVSVAWNPLIPLYGRMSEIFENEFYAAGASVRFGVLYNKPRWFNPGIELSMSWYDLKNAPRIDEIGMKTGLTGINIVAQKPLPKKMAVTLKAGASVIFQVSEINIEDYSYSKGGVVPQINLEASFLLFAYKKLYVEAGIGFYHLLSKDDNSGYLKPWLGAGWRF